VRCLNLYSPKEASLAKNETKKWSSSVAGRRRGPEVRLDRYKSKIRSPHTMHDLTTFQVDQTVRSDEKDRVSV
jgi:hypothetical protein